MTQVPANHWTPGMKSPNPKGRPPGPSKQQALLRRMLDEGEEVLDAVLAKAKEGDPASAGLVLSRILPVLKAQGEKVTFDLDPSLPLAAQVEQVLAAIASGQIAPDVGRQIIEAIGTLGNVRALEDLESRLAILEAKEIR
ncbi:hypothetical protein J3R80_10055 [Aliiroseovarius sp. Z3]|uniref:DUF5681 domain-containing protein n=1 Tax=Aliiroseovarius sp. Z3 TaxID=2811402 RepID=UPI0023B29ABF|nr:DUF5681 domain-containing protein [Aliiroseovarius sp. Z3]MDE9450807.1 hypothetical protein [Aliiroseovarius sp. Z3]